MGSSPTPGIGANAPDRRPLGRLLIWLVGSLGRRNCLRVHPCHTCLVPHVNR